MKDKFIIELRATVYRKNGKVFKEYPWIVANSLLKQFIQIFYAQASDLIQPVKDTSGVIKATGGWGSAGTFVAGVNNTTIGIVIGSGTNPVAMDDYKLQSQLTTNIAHAAQSLALENPDPNTWRTVISRALKNNTGNVLSIKEVALYGYGEGVFDKMCFDRTLYSVDVPIGLTITLTYKFTITL